jgi:hypothetical protein
MKREQFIEYLNQPAKLNIDTITELQTLSNQFPYCASIETLLCLNYFKEKNIQFESQLGKNAAIAADRKILKNHIDQLCETLEYIEFPDEFIGQTSKVVPEKEAVQAKKEQANEQESTPVKPKKIITDDFVKKAKETQAEALDKEIDERGRRDSEKIKALKERIEKKLAEIERAKKEGKGKTTTETSTKPVSKIDELKNENKSKSRAELIEQFIYTSPSITRHQSTFYNPLELAQQSIVDQENIVSETLAKIYYDQGYKEKATKIYHKLSLKYPEKSTYFAAQIEKIEKEIQ